MNRTYTYQPIDLTATDLEALEIELAERLTRRRFITAAGGLVGAAALGACGAGEQTGSDDTDQEATSGGTRTVEHALGTTEVPVEPQRIAVLDRQATLKNLVALGVIPLAAGVQGDLGFPEFLYPEVEDVESLPISDESFNLEQLAALEPDLMIGETRYVREDTFEQLSQIAPTVAIETNPFEWKPKLLFLGEFVGERQRAEQLIEDFEQRITEAAAQVGDVGTVTLLSIFPGDSNLRFWSPETSAGTWISELGGQLVPDLETLDGEAYTEMNRALFVRVGEELLSEADGETLILLQNPGSEADQQFLEEVQRSPLYQRLPAVQNDRVLTLDVQLALGNSGILGFQLALDNLIEFFSK